MRQYLKNNGFNVDCIPQNAYILTGKAYNDAQDASNIGTALGGTLMLHTFYKGINIDEVNPNEKEVRLYHTGTHGYGIEEWNFVEDGSIVTFNQNRASEYGSYWDRDGH